MSETKVHNSNLFLSLSCTVSLVSRKAWFQDPGLDRVGQAEIPHPEFHPESNSSCQSCSGILCSAVKVPFIGN